MPKFKDKVIETVRLIPKGKVVSYGQVALMVGIPRAARQVGWVLHTFGEDRITPWWRVVNRDGYISIKNPKYPADLQKKLLEKDGLKVGKNMRVEIEKYRFIPTQ